MTSIIEERVPYHRRIFCNRNLRLDRIETVGFDMDYTLALYHEAMEHLQAEMVLERLVERYGMPPEFLTARYDPRFAIRGLVVDVVHGNVFKMDAHRFVGRVWHGDGPLDKDLRRTTYTNRRISPADPNFVMVDTLFSLPEISLYCQLVAMLDAAAGDGTPDYATLWRSLRDSMDSLHADGTLKSRILQDVPRFIRPDPDLADTLHRLRSAGKRLFLLTNSEPNYTEAVMTFLLDGRHPGYPCWKDYFEIVLTSARKPDFFKTGSPFRRVRPAPDFSVIDEPIAAFKKGEIYVGGNITELAHLGRMQGEEVLYVGDHIYGDILRSKRDTSWRTAMVIQELDRELLNMQTHHDQLAALDGLEAERFQLNLERTARAVDGQRDRDLDNRVRDLNRRIAGLEGGIASGFNDHWGMLFRDRAELSAFGAQVEDYAGLYTSRVSNLRLYSPLWYFRSPRDRMPHEVEQ